MQGLFRADEPELAAEATLPAKAPDLRREVLAMLYAFFVAAALLLAAALYFGFREFGQRESRRFKASRLLTCPETNAPATVQTGGFSTFRIEECTRWPEKRHCGQACLLEVHESPDGCLVRTKVRNWYHGKPCILCDKPLEGAGWVTQPPCVMTADWVTHEWKDIRPEKIADTLETGKAVCWTCHVASEFRRQHANLIVERERSHRVHPAGGSA